MMAKNEHEVKNDLFGFGDKNVAFETFTSMLSSGDTNPLR